MRYGHGSHKGTGRMSGAGGSALDTPSTGLEKSVSGRDQLDQLPALKGDKQAAKNKPKSLNLDSEDWGTGNVSGSFSRPTRMS